MVTGILVSLWPLNRAMAKFLHSRTRTLLDALKRALEGLEDVRIFSSPEEVKQISELKKAIREKIADLEPPNSMAAD